MSAEYKWLKIAKPDKSPNAKATRDKQVIGEIKKEDKLPSISELVSVVNWHEVCSERVFSDG